MAYRANEVCNIYALDFVGVVETVYLIESNDADAIAKAKSIAEDAGTDLMRVWVSAFSGMNTNDMREVYDYLKG